MKHPFKSSKRDQIDAKSLHGHGSQRSNPRIMARWNQRMIKYMPFLGMAIGFFVIAVYCWSGWTRVNHRKYCLVLEDQFTQPELDEKVWTRQVELGGFGAESFDWTTDSTDNSYIKNGQLYITPTITPSSYLVEGVSVNLTSSGQCSSNATSDCYAITNSTAQTIVNPVQSARLTTASSKAIKFGRVEVKAKLPKGDWLWPAIWMMPRDSVYGVWPASGEIDIAEARGNAHFENYGRDVLNSALHWGPDTVTDMYMKTIAEFKPPRISFQEFHTFGLEWTPDYLAFYLDSKLINYYKLSFDKEDLWTLSGIPSTSTYTDPWTAGTKSAPFDQEFYLILNVAVAGTNGFFPEAMPGKPWTNTVARGEAMRQFYDAEDSWLPTWGDEYDRSMVVDSVKMWQQCDIST